MMRNLIEDAAPGAVPRISYKMPAFTINGKVRIWFGAFESHIGLYPGAAAVAAFKDDFAAYKTAKGSIQFPLDGPLPAKLISAHRSLRRARSAVARGDPCEPEVLRPHCRNNLEVAFDE